MMTAPAHLSIRDNNSPVTNHYHGQQKKKRPKEKKAKRPRRVAVCTLLVSADITSAATKSRENPFRTCQVTTAMSSPWPAETPRALAHRGPIPVGVASSCIVGIAGLENIDPDEAITACLTPLWESCLPSSVLCRLPCSAVSFPLLSRHQQSSMNRRRQWRMGVHAEAYN